LCLILPEDGLLKQKHLKEPYMLISWNYMKNMFNGRM